MENFDISWFNSVDVFHPKGSEYANYSLKPGFKNFGFMFGFFTANLSMTDRTGVLKLPVRTKILPQCRLPDFVPGSWDFDQLCQQRARWLLDHAMATNRTLTISYSGGIDSTLVLVSLLKVATEQELRDHTLVLLSEISIYENPNFYRNYVIKYFPVDSSYLIHAYLGNPRHIFITGEGNDQLFGSAVNQRLMLDAGENVIHSEPIVGNLVKLLNITTRDSACSEQIVRLFDKVANTAPIELPTVYHYFWWLNFTLKWQSVYARLLAYVAPKFADAIKPEDNYFTFFHVPEMQLWSMNNSDQLIKDDWRSYKFHCKKIIYDFNKDAEYRDKKAKWGSLARVVKTKGIAKTVDLQGRPRDAYPANVWNDDNDFV